MGRATFTVPSTGAARPPSPVRRSATRRPSPSGPALLITTRLEPGLQALTSARASSGITSAGAGTVLSGAVAADRVGVGRRGAAGGSCVAVLGRSHFMIGMR
ncbi:MAG: hypothetical protein QM704_06600 [Anaeromyxobacteraceae bacterium]